MSLLKDLAIKGKDLGVSKALVKLAQQYLGPFGEIADLRLDSKNSEIRLQILLRGENVPVEIEVKDYRIIEEGGDHFIAAENIRVSREWMDVLAREHLQGRRFRIPDKYSKILEKLAFS